MSLKLHHSTTRPAVLAFALLAILAQAACSSDSAVYEAPISSASIDTPESSTVDISTVDVEEQAGSLNSSIPAQVEISTNASSTASNNALSSESVVQIESLILPAETIVVEPAEESVNTVTEYANPISIPNEPVLNVIDGDAEPFSSQEDATLTELIDTLLNGSFVEIDSSTTKWCSSWILSIN